MSGEKPMVYKREMKIRAPRVLPVRNLASSFFSVNAQTYDPAIEGSQISTEPSSIFSTASRENVHKTGSSIFTDERNSRSSTRGANDIVGIKAIAERTQQVSPNNLCLDGEAAAFSFPDIELSLVLQRLLLEDLASAACVCRSWRAAASDACQLRTWTYDEDLMPTSSERIRFQTSTPVVLPKTPQPANWVDPQAHSPLAHFNTPKSLLHKTSSSTVSTEVLQEANHIFFGSPNPTQKSAKKPQIRATLKDIPVNLQETNERGVRESRMAGSSKDLENVHHTERVSVLSDNLENFGVGSSEQGALILPTFRKSQSSPRTPSPARSLSNSPSVMLGDALADMAYGRYIKEIDIRSSKLDDPSVQCIIRSCPNLQTLRLQHSCVGRQSPRTGKQSGTSLSPSPALEARSGSGKRMGEGEEGRRQAAYSTTPESPRCFRGCSALTDKGFGGISTHSRNLTSLTLYFQHMMSGDELHHIMSAVGAMPRLNMLALEFQTPCFPQSLKAQMKWQEHVTFTDEDLSALLSAGPPPLHALAVNQCQITPVGAALLANSCPYLQALDLSCDVAHFLKEEADRGLHPAIAEPLAGHPRLTALGIGIFSHVEQCNFATWQFPAVRRLRLESRRLPSIEELIQIHRGCPLLESLHLLWDHYNTKEAHICPVTEENIRDVHQECRVLLV